MGGKSSKDTKIFNEMVNEVTSEIMMKSTATCQTTAEVRQNIVLSGLTGVEIDEINQGAKICISQECMQDSKVLSDISNDLSRELENKIHEQLSGLQLSIKDENSKKNIHNSTKNFIKSVIKNENVTQAFSTSSVNQNVWLLDSSDLKIGRITQGGAIDVFNKISQRAWNENKMDNVVKEVISNESKHIEENPISSVIDSVAKGLHSILGLPFETAQALVIPLIIGGVIIFYVFMSSSPESQQNLTGLVQSARGPSMGMSPRMGMMR